MEPIESFSLKFNLKNQYRKCRHSGVYTSHPYHLEDDLWTHTCLVYNQVKSNTLKYVALFHDLGKLYTLQHNFEKDVSTFYGHAGVSAWKSLEYLKQLNIPHIQIVTIFSIIAAHMDHHFFDNNKLFNIYGKERYYSDLITFGNADTIGAITNHNPEFKEEKYVEIKKNEVKNKTITLLVGLPCSGKTHFRELLTNKTIISRDDILMRMNPNMDYNTAWKQADQTIVSNMLQMEINDATKGNNDVIIDMTNMTRKGRRVILNRFKDWNKECVLFLTSYDTIKERNESRSGKFIDDSVFLNMMKSFNIPTFAEFDKITYIME